MSRRTFQRPSGDRAERHSESPRVQASAAKRWWRERGYHDALKRRPRIARERLLELGGSLAVQNYFQGYRCGEQERTRA